MASDEVRAARTRAAHAHAAVLGDTSACTMARDGRPFPAGKFWEGQTAALTELLRTRTEDVPTAADRLFDEWQHRHIPGREREVEAYRAGGLEALAHFRSDAPRDVG